MELSFVIAALKRNGWLVVLFGVLGLFVSSQFVEPPRTEYQSTGSLLLSPSGFDKGVAYANQPDRFVLSQLGVLQAEGLAERVAEAVNAQSPDLSETAASVKRSTEMTQDLDTDIVVITAITGRPVRSELIAQAYLDLYIKEARETVQDASQPELDRLLTEIADVEAQLELNETRIQQAMEKYLPKITDEIARPIPDISLIDPEAAANVNTLGNELNALTTRRIAVDTERLSSFNSIIVQDATTPVEPIGNSTALVSAALIFVFCTLGLVIALVRTRFSSRVLDELQASEILGIPIVGDVDHSRSMRSAPLVAFDNLPSSLIPIIDQLSVRAEALGSVTEPLTVAVVGTQRIAGTTTLATAMAGRFSAAEFEVVLVDLDASDPYLSQAFDGMKGEGLAAVFGQTPDRAFSHTGRVGVTLLGRGRKAVSIRRDLVSTVLDVAKTRAHIVIIDAGSVLDAAATVELCDLVDAVVLAVPLNKQETRSLGHVARQFEPITRKVLPVITHPTSRRAQIDVSSSSTATPGRSLEEPERIPSPRQGAPTEQSSHAQDQKRSSRLPGTVAQQVPQESGPSAPKPAATPASTPERTNSTRAPKPVAAKQNQPKVKQSGGNNNQSSPTTKKSTGPAKKRPSSKSNQAKPTGTKNPQVPAGGPSQRGQS